ncbi:hypothetical protein [Rhodanobacter sp. MP1X3]|uniref:hypothetical protein n=1 Tax=Rhodanobacter sp. MP1X3 TaxID=2723086 RepID=UPI00161220B3|nr:hypothetical protein [Rhodanobacter sp. MP1X3]MBB6240738.1 hypothetical protein [Rhodanobacter sp. MP1X3]
MDVWTSITYRDFDKVDKAIRLRWLTHRQRNSFGGAFATTRKSEVLMIRQGVLFDGTAKALATCRKSTTAIPGAGHDASDGNVQRDDVSNSRRDKTGETRFHRSATMHQ